MKITEELQAVIDEAYEQHGYTDEGIACLNAKIRAKKTIRDSALDWAAANLLRMEMHSVRAEISRGTHEKAEAQQPYSEERAQAVEAACRRFLSRPMMDGTLLAKATREKLVEDAEHYEALAAGNAREARFLRLVAEKVEDGRKVEEVLKNEELEDLYEEAKRRRR